MIKGTTKSGFDYTVQKEQLKEHVRDEAGRVSIKRMFDEIGEILRGNQEGKNS